MKLSKAMIKVLRLMAKHGNIYLNNFSDRCYLVAAPLCIDITVNKRTVQALINRELIRWDYDIKPRSYVLTPAGRSALAEAGGGREGR